MSRWREWGWIRGLKYTNVGGGGVGNELLVHYPIIFIKLQINCKYMVDKLAYNSHKHCETLQRWMHGKYQICNFNLLIELIKLIKIEFMPFTRSAFVPLEENSTSDPFEVSVHKSFSKHLHRLLVPTGQFSAQRQMAKRMWERRRLLMHFTSMKRYSLLLSGWK